MKIAVIVILLGGLGLGPFSNTLPAAEFQVGVFGDDERNVTCVTGPPGAVFEQVAWVQVPNGLGLAYVTLRFDFPTNLDLSSAPVFNELMTRAIMTDFPDGTVEWNMIFAGCPSGWVRLFSQDCELLDDQPSRIGIIDVRSMVRDCTFILNDVVIMNEMKVNTPGCTTVSVDRLTWGGIKSSYR